MNSLPKWGSRSAFPCPLLPTNADILSMDYTMSAWLLTMKQKVVGNDVNADDKKSGDHHRRQSGRQIHLPAQHRPGPVDDAVRHVCAGGVFLRQYSASGLFTHYKREEDTTMKSGKLDEELSRMSEIVDHITPNSMVLFNESFAATNEREGSEIARQIVSALVEKSIKVFFVTHLYTFAHSFYDQGMANAAFLVAERQADGERTFRMIEGVPSQTSFGEDLYARVFGTVIETREVYESSVA